MPHLPRRPAARDAARPARYEARLARALAGRTDPRGVRRLAEEALDRGRPEDAGHLLALLPPGLPGLAGTKARHDRELGRLTESVVGLRRAVASGRAGAAERRQLHRHEDELRLLSGLRPVLPSAVAPRPEPGTVLHVRAAPEPDPPVTSDRTHAVLAEAAAQGRRVVRATGGRRGSGPELADGVAHHRLDPSRPAPTASGRLQQQAQALLDLALDVRPAVLHAEGGHADALVVRAVAEALGLPWVHQQLGCPAARWAARRPAAAAGSEVHRLLAARETEALLAADRALVAERAAARRLEELRPGAAVRTVPVPLDPASLGTPLPAAQARRAAGLPAAVPVLGAVAGPGESDGIDDLLRAAALVVAGAPQLLVVVLADGPGARARLEARAAAHGVLDRLRVVAGTAPERRLLVLRAVDVLVAPLRAPVTGPEPPGVAEALAAGTPVVASRLPALAELVADGITGMLTPAGDPATLATVLGMLLGSPAVRRCLGDEARRRVLAERGPAAVAAALTAAWDELAVPAPARGATA
ncbi:glycosyltransferase [Kocuria flava]|uniref:glycosyltransferase family 4 protein n=1 Tax=Kocuria flava TaxID=446860 RepID=UPI001FF4019E|nr:glycosyltransferase [Kocuria flava]MCJ8506142.1 glycosyltransferase [Kocuria flava]